MPLLELNNVSLSFKDQSLFENINLSINKGDKLVISGPSGTGKTSLLKLILGFIPGFEGQISFQNETITHHNIWKVRRSIGYISQDSDIGEGKVGQLIEDIFSLKVNIKLKPDPGKIKELFHFFRLEESTLAKDFEELSGGEKKRVAIIISILLKRDFFFLDEITSGLDDEVLKTVIGYFMESDHTAIIISHDKEWMKKQGVKEFKLN
ncbi:MAG: ATP-binding cassette domain-containing protein [Bacteroidetes bacterium]|nr:ATP-binding cassette domain-containing protein [Bacteroidota bacterium]MBL6962653.1 ATP-binding cassette domain-containing protein [Bacteroidota bacterium]